MNQEPKRNTGLAEERLKAEEAMRKKSTTEKEGPPVKMIEFLRFNPLDRVGEH